MHFYIDQAPIESYSRQLDKKVAMQEMPYGYEYNPPPADTGDYDQERLESQVKYKVHKGKVHA